MKIICSFLIFSSVSLFAQENSSVVPSSSTSEVRHVGVGNFYKIGTADNPVTANEYCAFLNSENRAKDENYLYSRFFLDNSFMNCTYASVNFSSWSYHHPVEKNDCIERLNEYTFRYVVIPGRGNYIIDGITKWRGYGHNDSTVFRTFNTWRKNPMAQEISDYLNDKIGGRDSDADAIKNKYVQDIDRASIFHWLDVIAVAAHNNQSLCVSLKIIDEENRAFITFSMQSDDISFHEGPIQASVVPGMEYYRPSLLMKLL